MERLTARDQAGNAYFPECFKEPCGGGGCTKDHCEFLDSVCDKLAGYEEQAEQAEKLLAESEAARAELGRRLAAAQKMNAELTDAQAVMVREFTEKLEELCAYKSTGLEPERIEELIELFTDDQVVGLARILRNAFDSGEVDHIRDLLQAEQDGLLVVLPKKTVWELTMDAGPDCDMKCLVDAWDESLGCDLCSKAKQFAYERPCTQDLLKELGKTVFLTREEAEAAMAQEGGTNEADSV